MKRARILSLSAIGAAVALVGSLALAQQPPGRPFPGRGFPPNHPPVPGMGQPGRPPMILGPDGRPQGLGHGQRFPGRPGMGWPGRQGRPGHPTFPRRPHVEEEEHAGGGEEHFCPGHGPDDPPPPPNYWHGMLMVNNELAQKPGLLNQLLFRYENPSNPCDPRNEPAPYMASLLNFAVLCFILYRFGKKPMEESLLKRKQAIMADVDAATKLYEDAESRLEDYEERLENIEDKLDEVRAEYAAQAEIEKKHILAEAEERRARMRRDAEFRIEQERKAVRDQLLEEAVVAATAAAEALIQKQMSRADHDRMAADYLATVGASLRHDGGHPAGANS